MTRIRGDKSNPVTRGYACIKGLTLHEAHYAPDRILHPLRRRKDGGFERVPLNVALDEIAARVAEILAAHGPDAVAGFRGTMNYTNSIANQMLPDWLAAMGSHSFFSTMTIDQSAKWVTAGRLGSWEAGKDPYEVSDVLLLFGANPLVSLSTFTLTMQNPVKAIREAKARGVAIIVVDPRQTETAAFADILAQPLPGEDVTFVAGMLRTIFQEGWHDADFCAAYADGMEALRHAVEPFDPAYVSLRTGVPIAELRAVVEAFAAPLHGRRKRGAAVSGTGPNMAAHANLAEHLIECLNVVCGRYARAGDRVMNPGVLGPRRQYRAQVRPPTRSWETGWKDAKGYGRIFGERMTATLPDAIMNSGAGQVRALFVDGGNPANALADTSRTRHALAALDLLVAIDPFMTETATLAHYVLPPPMMLERPDIGSRDWETFTLMTPYAQYSEAVIAPPEGGETIEDWRVFWEVARRTGHNIMFDGVPLDRDTAPEAEELISILLRHSALPLHEIRAATQGAVFDVPAMTVLPAIERDRFNVAPQDVLAELTSVAAEPFAKESLRLAVRRMRDVQNSMYHQLPELERRAPENPVWMNPEDMAERGIADHALVHISSAHGMVEGRAMGDATLRRGVASMTHGWGGGRGVNVNNLTSLVKDCDPINAMPVLTGFPISIQSVSCGH
jgi:anaerobic selenocysteine-containing dehydrogenase